MRWVSSLLVLAAFVGLVAFVTDPPLSNIALFWIVRNDVERKLGEPVAGNPDNWSKAKKGDLIYAGDFIRTQKQSFALIKFNDASTLRLGPSSEVQVYGDRTPAGTNVNGGDVGFTITKRKNRQFEFTTPTSVASIRGTRGLLTVSDDGTDLLTIVEGLVLLTNKFSNKSVQVGAGQTGESSKLGDITVRQSTQQDLDRLTKLNNEFNQQHKIEMWFRGNDGQLHEIIIETED
jgi:hypothetical protein